jgi:hypothetical protein
MWRGIVFSGTGRVLFFEDVAAYFEPLWSAAARSMRAGHAPGWALEAFSGQPLLGDPQLGFFYPPHWIWLLVAPVRAYAISIVAHDALAATGTYALLRALGRSRPASVAGALALSLSAYFVLEARHEMFIVSAAWLPWLLWAIAAHARNGDARSMTMIAFTSALALLGGGWSMLVFAAPVVIAFSAFRLRVQPRPSVAMVRLGGLVTGALLGLALAAVQLLPALVHARLSPRALPLAEAFAGSYAWPSLRYLVTLILPTWFGDDGRGNYTGAPDQWELCGYGIGVIGAVCAAVCAIGSLRRRPRRAETITYLALIGGAVLIALGPNCPVRPLWPLWRAAPLLSQTRCPARALFVYTLVAPLLCAAGVDHLHGRLRAWVPRRARLLAWALPALIAIELLVTFRADNPTLPIAEARVAAAVSARLPSAPSPDGGRAIIDVHLGQPFHNGGLRWGFETAGGYSSLPLWRYLHLLWIANHGRTYPGSPRPALAHDLTAQGLWTYASPLVDLLAVRWAIVPHDRTPDGSGWQRTTVGADGVDLWENLEALPRARLLHRVRRVADEGAAAEAIAAPDFEPAREVVLEEDVRCGAEGPAEPAASLEVAPGAASYRITASSDGVLVLAEPWDPWWRASLDGAAVPILRADYALMGLSVPRGEHAVRLVRRDRALELGAAVSLLALLMCAALALLRGSRAR